jgi:hypothetical protein
MKNGRVVLWAAAGFALLLAFVAVPVARAAPSPQSGPDWSLDMNAVFGYAENVITNMLPLAYLTGGLSLGFVVISKIIGAFK